MVGEEREVLEFEIRAEYLNRPDNSEALAFARGVISFRGRQASAPKAYGVPDPRVVFLEERAAYLLVASVRVDAERLVGVRQAKDRRACERVLQCVERVGLFFRRGWKLLGGVLG